MGRRHQERLPGKHPIFKQTRATATPHLPPYVADATPCGHSRRSRAGRRARRRAHAGGRRRQRRGLPAALRPRQGAARAGRRAGAAGRACTTSPRQLLGGGRSAFRRRLDELKGYPVVVNKWASWCAPCRTEFPFFQSQAASEGQEGRLPRAQRRRLDAIPPRSFLRASPLPFPSYVDPKEDIAKTIQRAGQLPDHGLLRRARQARLRAPGRLPRARPTSPPT